MGENCKEGLSKKRFRADERGRKIDVVLFQFIVPLARPGTFNEISIDRPASALTGDFARRGSAPEVQRMNEFGVLKPCRFQEPCLIMLRLRQSSTRPGRAASHFSREENFARDVKWIGPTFDP